MADKRKTKGIPVVVWVQKSMVLDIDRAAKGNRSYWIRSAIEQKLGKQLK